VYAVAVALSLGLLLAAAPAAAECDPDNAIFEDDFEFLDASWNNPSDSFYVEDGALIIKSFWGNINPQTQSEAANVCLDTTIVEASDPDQSPIGVVWWWENWDNYYYLFYWANSDWIEVRRYVKGQHVNVAAVQTLALKQGAGETNHIELRLKPKDATIFINDTEVLRFKGKPPKGGGSIGVYGTSPEDKPATYSFDNVIVSVPSE
jgi:hypothetical protein